LNLLEDEIAPEAVVHIRRVGDTLTSSVDGLPERELFAASPTEFFRTDFDATIRIVGDELTITVSGTNITARRRQSRKT
jgi:hypothetical protein